ncbi:MAG TPA: hypothetical protein VH853_22620 [Polyangia bacterium]|nr:hypothetical protein [Polyangia bacterium]
MPGLFAVVASSGLGCATPAPIVRLDPISNHVFWISGRPVVTQEDRGVRVAAAFQREAGKTLGVRVEIQNQTHRELDIDPAEEFSFISCKGASESSCMKETFVIDPEEMLAGLDAKASRERAQAANDDRALGGLVLLSAVADTASLADGHGGFARGGVAPLGTEGAVSAQQGTAASHDRALGGIEAQRNMWSDDALRHSTLLPGASVGGQVFIPADNGVQHVWLRIRVGARTFPFHFRMVAEDVSSQG